MRHIVLGATGFIGHHVVKRLLAGCEDVILTSQNGLFVDEDADLRSLEVRQFQLAQGEYDQLIEGCDVVHHYAWSTLPSTAARDPASDVAMNLAGSIRLLQAMARHGGQRLVFASSGGTVYGRGAGRPALEDDPTCPLSAYGISKLTLEHYIKLFAASNALEARIARISNPFGGVQRAKKDFGVVAHFTRAIIAGKPLQIFGDGQAIRDFLYIEDLADALFLLATCEIDKSYSICNIGGGTPTSLLRLIEAIEGISRRQAQMSFLAAREFDLDYSCLNIERIKTACNWEPRFDLKAGLEKSFSDLRR